MLQNRPIKLLLTALLAAGLTACGEGSDLLGPGPGQIDVGLMVNQDVTEATLADAQAALDAVAGGAPLVPGGAAELFGEPDPETLEQARELLQQARQKWVEARQAWANGDTELAEQLAMEARLLVAEAIILVFGEDGYERLLLRVDQVISFLTERVDDEPSELLARILELRAEAEALRGEDLVAATERLLLALQIAHRERVRHRQAEMAQHARLSVFMAGAGVELATEIAGDDATEEQVQALRHSAHLLSEAEAALAEGRVRLAHVLAREAVNLSLVAVMLEPGMEDDRLLAMIELSERAIAAAEEALAGQDPAGFAVRLLEHAKSLQARAIAGGDQNPRRAIHVLWHVSVTAYGLIQYAST